MNAAEVWEGFAKALEGHPWVSVDDLARELNAGEATICKGERSAVFVRLSLSPVLECGPACGDIDEVTGPLRAEIEHFAAQHGFTEIHIQAGRQGFARKLRPHGYEEAAVILRKRINGTQQ